MKSRPLSFERKPVRTNSLVQDFCPALGSPALGKVLISEGDPSGISYELIESSRKTLLNLGKKNQITLVRSQNSLVPDFFNQIDQADLVCLDRPGLYQIYTPMKTTGRIIPGKPGIYPASCAWNSFINAISLQKKTGADLITLPLSKEWIIRAGVKNFTGHTETLADQYHCKTWMLMAGKKLNVMTLTTHVPLVKVAAYLKKLDINGIADAIIRHFGKGVKIGFLGLNPHAGEGGKIGSEESDILEPMIKVLKKKGLLVLGPLAADSAFIGNNWQKFDLFLSCYHDQGLIPFKMIEDKNGVNISLGLDFIRVSPDHGTAFDIAGRGIASPDSFLQCLNLLCGKKNGTH